MGKRLELSGLRFGLLEVLRCAGKRGHTIVWESDQFKKSVMQLSERIALAAGRRHAVAASLQRFSLQRIIKRLEGRA